MYLNPKYSKIILFQRGDYTSLNCHLTKFDCNVMMAHGYNIPICTEVSFTVHQSFHSPYTAQVLGKISQSNITSVCSSSIDHVQKVSFNPDVCLGQFTFHVCDATLTLLSGINIK